jgi:hypothetical protein
VAIDWGVFERLKDQCHWGGHGDEERKISLRRGWRIHVGGWAMDQEWMRGREWER